MLDPNNGLITFHSLGVPHTPGNLTNNRLVNGQEILTNGREISQGTVVGFNNATRQTLVRESGSGNIIPVSIPGATLQPGTPVQLTQQTNQGFQRVPTGGAIDTASQTISNSFSNEGATDSGSFDLSSCFPDGAGSQPCPVGFSPRCNPDGNGCFGCLRDEENPVFPIDLVPLSDIPDNIPGDPGDGCGGPGDNCSWYEGQECPVGTFSKGFIEFPTGTFRVLCCGGEDRPQGIGCNWQEPTPEVTVSYSCTEVDGQNFCLAVYDGSGNFQTLEECQANCSAGGFDCVDTSVSARYVVQATSSSRVPADGSEIDCGDTSKHATFTLGPGTEFRGMESSRGFWEYRVSVDGGPEVTRFIFGGWNNDSNGNPTPGSSRFNSTASFFVGCSTGPGFRVSDVSVVNVTQNGQPVVCRPPLGGIS